MMDLTLAIDGILRGFDLGAPLLPCAMIERAGKIFWLRICYSAIPVFIAEGI